MIYAEINLMPYSRYTAHAAQLFGHLIRTARLERKMTVQELAERAAISRGLVQRIEKGDLKCSLGAYFEVSAILGIPLFDADDNGLVGHLERAKEKLALLPKTIKKPRKVIDDF